MIKNLKKQEGFVPALTLLVLMAGLVAGVYLAGQTQIFKPRASQIETPESSLSLIEEPKVSISKCPDLPFIKDFPEDWDFICPQYDINPNIITVKLYARSDIEAANLFAAKLKFTTDLLEVISVQTHTVEEEDQICAQVITKACHTVGCDGENCEQIECQEFPTPCDVPDGWWKDQENNSEDIFQYFQTGFIKNWIEQSYDNSLGTISLVGGIPDPGYKSEFGQSSPVMATIIFQAKKAGLAKITFDETSAIYSNAKNENILTVKRDLDIDTSIPSPRPIPSDRCESDNDCQEGAKCENIVCLADDPYESGCFGKCVESKATYVKSFTFRAYPDDPTKIQFDLSCQPDKNRRIVAGIFSYGDGSPDFTFDYGEKGPGELTNLSTSHVYKAGTYTGTGLCRDDRGNLSKPKTISLTVTDNTNGDANGDGKINLVDLSILLSDFNKTGNFRVGVDMNKDGIVNSIDFKLLRILLVEQGVIKQ